MGKIYDVVEGMPSYPGGDEAMYQYISENLGYPKVARLKGIEGRCYVRFVVEKNGDLTNIQVARGLGYGCDEEAMRVVRNMPSWNPPTHKGVPARCLYIIPITFKLPN